MEPTSLIVGAAVGAGTMALFGNKKPAARKPRATAAKRKPVAKKATAKKPVARKATAKKPAAKKKAVSKANRQTGTSKRSEDKQHQAKKPGKRVSANGNVYYERRANRSDVGKLLAV